MSEPFLRDCQAWKDIGLSLSTTSNEAAKLFDDVITQYITWTENPDCGLEGSITKLLEADQHFVMGKALSIGLELMGTGRAIHLDEEFSNKIQAFEIDANNCDITPREKLHCCLLYTSPSPRDS